MQIDFYARLPDDRENLDIEFFADIYLDDDDDTAITVSADGLPQEEFREQVLTKCLAGLLAVSGELLTVDGLVVDLDGEDEDADFVAGDWLEDIEEYLDDEEVRGC